MAFVSLKRNFEKLLYTSTRWSNSILLLNFAYDGSDAIVVINAHAASLCHDLHHEGQRNAFP